MYLDNNIWEELAPKNPSLIKDLVPYCRSNI